MDDKWRFFQRTEWLIVAIISAGGIPGILFEVLYLTTHLGIFSALAGISLLVTVALMAIAPPLVSSRRKKAQKQEQPTSL